MAWWCDVCQNNMFVSENITVLSCGHLFHAKCQVKLIKDGKPCAICKTDINVTKIRTLDPSIRDDDDPNMLELKSKNSCTEEEVIDGLTTQVKDFQDNIELLNINLKQTNEQIESYKNLHKDLQKQLYDLKINYGVLLVKTCYNQKVDTELRSELEKLKDNPKELISKFSAAVFPVDQELTRKLNAINDLEQSNELLENKIKTNEERIKNLKIICEDYEKQLEEYAKLTRRRPTCKSASIDSSTIVIDVDENETPLALSDTSPEDASSITCKTDVKKRRKRKPKKK